GHAGRHDADKSDLADDPDEIVGLQKGWLGQRKDDDNEQDGEREGVRRKPADDLRQGPWRGHACPPPISRMISLIGTAPASWMATSLPATITPMRSAIVATSSRSDETTRMAAPRSRSSRRIV